MKNFKKIFAIILTLCMMSTLFIGFGVSANAEEPAVTKWENNEGAKITAQDACQSLFSKTNSAFSYGTYVRGDSTTAGTTFNTTDGLTDPNLYGLDSAGHIYDGYKYSCWPNYNYGVKFTAPYTGTIKVTYQLGQGGMTNAALMVGGDNLVINSSGGTSNQIKEITMIGTDFTQTATMELEVSANQNLYFIVRNLADYHDGYFWINSVEYTNVVPVDGADVIGYSISALETPVVNFYVQLDGNPMGTYAEIKVGSDKATKVMGEAYTGAGPDGTDFTASDFVFVYSIPVSAKRMTETITISIKKDGQELLSANTTYSVNQYCQAQVAKYVAAGTGATQDQIDVAKACTAILVYGRSMQKYFNYNTDNLPAINATLLELVNADMQ